MKHIALFLLIQCSGIILFSQGLTPTDDGSKVSFKIKNFGFNVEGSFKGLRGTVRFDPNDLAGSSFDVSVDAATVNTDNDMRDSHLKNETYFDVSKYPRIRLVSTKVVASNKGGTYILYGKLTIKDKTQDLSFPFAATASNGGYLFAGEFKINRKDFGVGGSSTISDNLTVSLSVMARQK
ncbi:MAG: YceI family protein [Puia sp.]|nr:YceI family protein [Puia sp.]